MTLFVLVSVVSGVLVAGLALPVVGSVGLVARTASDSYQAIPDVLMPPALPQQSILLAADGSRLATFYDENRIVVDIDAIDPQLQKAVVAVEDSRFYEHDGVDLRGTLRALATNSQSGQIQQGGSTLTMQYVKNVLLTAASTEEDRQAAREQSVSRKLREWRLATGLEKRWTKQQILEGYLNIAYFGAGAYGAEAASRRYFGTSAAELTLPQAALLAGIVQQPVAFDPLRNPKSAQARRDVVLQRMLDQGYITTAEYGAAVATPIKKTLKPKRLRNGCSETYAPYFCDYVYQVILNDPVFGETPEARESFLKEGGLVIRTTLDPKIQRETQKAVDAAIPRRDPSKKVAAAVFVEPGTGAILAMAQNRSYGVESKRGVTSINYLVDKKYNGTIGLQAGSTFKAFTLIAALEKGLPVSERISATELQGLRGRLVPELQGQVSAQRELPGRQLDLVGHLRHASGDRLLGEHLLRRARAPGRPVRDRPGCGGARRPHRDGSASPAGGVTSPWGPPSSPRSPWRRRTPRWPRAGGTATPGRSSP